MLPSAVSTMPVPSSPESADVTMIDTTDGSNMAAVCATEPDGRLTTGCATAEAADPEGVDVAATGSFVVFLVAATRPPATTAPINAAIPATANNDGQPDRRPALVDLGSAAGSPYGDCIGDVEGAYAADV